jgi:hypothetical protein
MGARSSGGGLSAHLTNSGKDSEVGVTTAANSRRGDGGMQQMGGPGGRREAFFGGSGPHSFAVPAALTERRMDARREMSMAQVRCVWGVLKGGQQEINRCGITCDPGFGVVRLEEKRTLCDGAAWVGESDSTSSACVCISWSNPLQWKESRGRYCLGEQGGTTKWPSCGRRRTRINTLVVVEAQERRSGTATDTIVDLDRSPSITHGSLPFLAFPDFRKRQDILWSWTTYFENYKFLVP